MAALLLAAERARSAAPLPAEEESLLVGHAQALLRCGNPRCTNVSGPRDRALRVPRCMRCATIKCGLPAGREGGLVTPGRHSVQCRAAACIWCRRALS